MVAQDAWPLLGGEGPFCPRARAGIMDWPVRLSTGGLEPAVAAGEADGLLGVPLGVRTVGSLITGTLLEPLKATEAE